MSSSIQPLCQTCKTPISHTPSDLDFYAAKDVPVPKNCPQCRYKQRLLFRNEHNLYKRQCSATGQTIVSIYTQAAPFPVYSQEYWWSDRWNAQDYGREFDFSRPFFEQFGELFRSVPQLALNNSGSENALYTNQAQFNKNSYMIFSSAYNDNCYYGTWYKDCRDCMDCLYLEKSELCYEVVNGQNCYRCTFSQNLENCSEVHFSKNLIGCKDCFGCINLRNKQYHIFNKAYSKDEYERHLPQLKAQMQNLQGFFLQHPHKYYIGKNNENFSGDYIQQVKDSHNAFNCRYNENTHYCYDVWESDHCRDATETLATHHSLQIEGSTHGTDLAFCMKHHNTSFSRYSTHCFSSSNLFGCVGLRSAQFCILNKAYSKEEFLALRTKIIQHMKKTGEWGEYFPKELSPFAYNETVAQEYFPLTEQEALATGHRWAAPSEDSPLQALQVQTCEVTGKKFKIIQQEQEFYTKMGLSIPRRCPDQRHEDRMTLRNPRVLNHRSCQRCEKPLQTSFSLISPEIVYCEECYLNAVS